MPWDNDGENSGKEDSPKDSLKSSKGPWGGTSSKGRRSSDPSGSENRGRKEDIPPNPWVRRNGPSSSGGNNIDDLIDAIQGRIRNMMSGGGSGGNPKGSGPKGNSPKGSWRTVTLLGIVAVVLWLGTGFYRVQEGEVGVVLRFGEMVRTSLPGLQYHLPAPFESVIVQKVAVVNTIDGGMKAEKNGDSADATLIFHKIV